ncbi:eukaryotic translation initiation factor 1-like [Eptesicus fuscus]|uniref:eukaryotic translation initiation factor 1-like n=1 Tax=Eptesicus fuscus TaxID=29078 RepID=UPI002403FE00|nr:eukaryotic translation initiation factor 1-like [Eptesicus fuscus]
MIPPSPTAPSGWPRPPRPPIPRLPAFERLATPTAAADTTPPAFGAIGHAHRDRHLESGQPLLSSPAAAQAPKPLFAGGKYVRYQNLHSFDPFADTRQEDDLLPTGAEYYIHTRDRIRIQQRNGISLSTVQGIAGDYDKMKLVKAFKMKLAWNGTAIEHPEYGEVIQLQGDQRKNIYLFLVETGLAKDDQLKVHSF